MRNFLIGLVLLLPCLLPAAVQAQATTVEKTHFKHWTPPGRPEPGIFECNLKVTCHAAPTSIHIYYYRLGDGGPDEGFGPILIKDVPDPSLPGPIVTLPQGEPLPVNVTGFCKRGTYYMAMVYEIWLDDDGVEHESYMCGTWWLDW